MNANSKGSVTPQMKEQIAAEATRPIAAFFLAGFAHFTIARAHRGHRTSYKGRSRTYTFQGSRIHQRLSHLSRSAADLQVRWYRTRIRCSVRDVIR